ncbi:hypothetical protein TNCV_793471 [Trichonephila clavipes]|nr:hypothetical protein TNCV_793471 [Trichonephila clavipes]
MATGSLHLLIIIVLKVRSPGIITELPQATERFIPLESERAKMLSGGPDAMAQPVTVPEEKVLPRALLISADEM